MSNGINGLREFGNFRLDVEKRVLWYGEDPVGLPPKEIELLSALTERGGEVLTKEELLEKVWPDSFVEESNLSRNIYRIRKAFEQLGEDAGLIQTVPRRGYRFAGEVRENADIIIERHSISKTLIEELENSADPGLKPAPSFAPRSTGSRYFLPLGAIALLLIISLASYLYTRSGATPGQSIKSIAVLPLRSLSGSDDKALGLGFADALISNLGKLNEVKVLSTNAVSGYNEEKQDTSEIGRHLGVDAALEGTFQQMGGKFRVTLRLIRTADGKQIWTETFDQSEDDIFGLQDKIAVKTAKFLETNFSLKTREAILKHYTANPEAYMAYQTGRYHYLQVKFEKAIAEFERALKFDAKYALAYSGLSDAYARIANRSAKEKRVENYEKAKSYALQALLLDENLAEAHASLGWIRRIYDWDWAESEKHLRRAIELDPNFATAYARLAYLYITLGKTSEAVELTGLATKLDPVNHGTAWPLFCDRQYEASAADYLRQVNTLNSAEHQNDDRIGAAMAFSELGRYGEAIKLLEEIPAEFQDSYKAEVSFAIAYHRGGQTEKAAELLKKLEQTAKTGPGYATRLAYVYAAMGKNDEAIGQLRKGFEERDDRMMWIKTTPYFDKLRDDPRFQEILRKMNLPG